MSILTERLIKRSFFRAVALYTALIAMAWCALFPVLWGLSGSLKKEAEVSQPSLLPSHPQWSNYAEVFTLMPFWRMFANTVLYGFPKTNTFEVRQMIRSNSTKVRIFSRYFHNTRC